MRLLFTDPRLRSHYPNGKSSHAHSSPTSAWKRPGSATPPPRDPVTSDAEPDQQLIIYTPEPGSRSEQALRELAAWAAEHIGTPR